MLDILSENYNKGVVDVRRQQNKAKATDCPYCQGKGYFQLLLGGSETCDNCGGSGAKQNPTS
ncbi:hypothetical protein ATG70_2780 [Bacillus sp. es.036]|nr:hypothetical protein ATG70_2780 [Bacillus sp. es.036]